MGQNLASVHFTAEQWAAVDEAFDALEEALMAVLVSLSHSERKRVVKMGAGSETFCRHSYVAMRDNVVLLSRKVDIDEMSRDLATHDALAERLARLNRLRERMEDTDIALGSDIMRAALDGYVFLKVFGKSEGLGGLRRGLGKRFEGQGATRVARLPGAANDPQ
jgi:hypothetical protein